MPATSCPRRRPSSSCTWSSPSRSATALWYVQILHKQHQIYIDNHLFLQILSFLGAIHWGLEFAGYGGTHGYRRYAIGVIAPAVAWPTLLLPVEGALISQFLAFTFLYYADARAAARGWAPHWYGIYRFVLTFVVGASLVASLIAHGHIAGYVTQSHGPSDKLQALKDVQSDQLEKEEAETRKNLAAKEEAEEDDE